MWFYALMNGGIPDHLSLIHYSTVKAVLLMNGGIPDHLSLIHYSTMKAVPLMNGGIPDHLSLIHYSTVKAVPLMNGGIPDHLSLIHYSTMKAVPLMECMYLVFTRMPGERYSRRLRSCSCVCVTSFERLLPPLCVDSLFNRLSPKTFDLIIM